MDIRRLEIFLKILETKSFSKTAAALGLTQPSISASLKALEEFFGHKLFERTPRLVKPLPTAHLLAPYAADIVQSAGRAAWALSRQMPSGESLSVGASSVPALSFLPQVLADFSQKYPHILIKLKSGHSRDISKKVLDGELDLAVVGAQPDREELAQTPLHRDHLVLLCSDELAQRLGPPPRTVEELAAWPLILREEGSGTRDALMSALAGLRANPAKLNIKAEVDGFGPASSLARASLGAALFSSLIIPSINMEGLKVIDLTFLGRRHFYLLHRRSASLSPAIEALVKMINKSVSKPGSSK